MSVSFIYSSSRVFHANPEDRATPRFVSHPRPRLVGRRICPMVLDHAVEHHCHAVIAHRPGQVPAEGADLIIVWPRVTWIFRLKSLDLVSFVRHFGTNARNREPDAPIPRKFAITTRENVCATPMVQRKIGACGPIPGPEIVRAVRSEERRVGKDE